MPNEQANVARFLRGEPKPADHNAAWQARVRAFVNAGKTIGRVRVVRPPLTDYQRYQFAWGVPGNLAAGEDIRVLDLTMHAIALPGYDWWMFDDKTVVQLNFRNDGTQINRELLEDADLAQFREWRRLASEASVAFAEYMKAYGDAHT